MSDDFPSLVYKKRFWNALNAKFSRESPLAVKGNGESDPMLLDKRLHFLPLILNGNPQNDKPSRLVAAIGLLEKGHFLQAGDAPGSPKVYEEGVAEVALLRELLSREKPQLKSREGVSPFLLVLQGFSQSPEHKNKGYGKEEED